MKLYQNGVSTYMGGTGTHVRALRGEVVGWSPAAARRQTRWLWSVDSSGLTGAGYALTLTVRDTPPSSDDFTRIREGFFKRVCRMGAVRFHWVTEWQARGTPHIHCAVYFPHWLPDDDVAELVSHWLAVARPYGADPFAQDVKPITGPVGWLKYLSKHASRGVQHYQRQGHPEGWAKTGRLWGHGGGWPVVEPLELEGLNNREFYRVRRLLRAWAYADARKAGDLRRMRYLRASAQRADAKASRFLGAAEWVPEHVTLRLVDFLEREN